MARSIQVIAQSMLEAKAADTNLSGLTSTSQTAIWRLWIFIVAACINIFEQLQDSFKIDLENISLGSIAGTPQWVRQKTFEFQYSATVPQVVSIVDNVLQYPLIDDTLKVVTRCSVLTGVSNTVSVKVAKATSSTDPTPVKLSAIEESALAAYWGVIGFAGINYNIINKDADLIGITAEVYYDGQYASIISSNVISALDNYLASIPFDGYVSVLGIEDAIQAVLGVSDVKITEASGRASTTSFASRFKFYDLTNAVNSRRYSTASGYCKQETTALNTFADTITFIVK